jgi:hypothetical protein
MISKKNVIPLIMESDDAPAYEIGSLRKQSS